MPRSGKGTRVVCIECHNYSAFFRALCKGFLPGLAHRIVCFRLSFVNTSRFKLRLGRSLLLEEHQCKLVAFIRGAHDRRLSMRRELFAMRHNSLRASSDG